MAYYSFLIKPASSLCNLRCRYCFYADVSARRSVPSYGLMSREVMEAVLKKIYGELKAGDEVAFSFQGGEPTLAGLAFFQSFVEAANRENPGIHPHYSIQTNGILLDEDWCRFLLENHFLVGLSLDGNGGLHDKNRTDPSGRGTWKRVMAAKRLLEKEGVPYNVLWVLTEETARHPEQVWRFLREQKIGFVQFIPCLGELEEPEEPRKPEGSEEEGTAPWVLTPRRFASFYIGLFRLWSQAFLAGEYRSVKFFDDLLNLLAYRRVTACGFTGSCQNQMVIEADGSVYPCDFFVLDRWRLGNLTAELPSALQAGEGAEAFLSRKRPDRAPCGGCPYENFCHGGCPRMYGSLVERATGFCGYREFLTRCRGPIEQIAALLSRA